MGSLESLRWFAPELVLSAALLFVIAVDLIQGRDAGEWPGTVAFVGAVLALVTTLLLPGVLGSGGLLGAWQTYPALTVVAASAVVLTAGYMLWALQRMYLGAPNPRYATTGWEINGRELFTLVPLAVIVVFLGIYPKAILNLQSPRLVEIADQVKAAAPAARVASR